MKRKEPTVIDSFTASNGITIEFAPDPEAGKPFTDEEWKKARILTRKEAGITPEFLAAWEEMRQARKRGRPRKAKPKINATLRMDADLVDALRATGRGWQTRINDALRTLLAEHRL